ncbi:MAG: N-acetylmuramoyl-L-alanine amidase [Candidatus Wallbacteria bacterium]|nr:N-acetylmuramoyl-L-alanine amidase [Candidatus Wallbacteria bacterium]
MKNPGWNFIVIMCVLMYLSLLSADEYDYRQAVSELIDQGGAPAEDSRLWVSYIEKASGVSVSDTLSMFREAASEFSVPETLLEAIGYLENNWTQIGPTVDRGWGVMHLVENGYCDTLGEAARLLNLDRQMLKDDPRQNIRGAAALLASYARESCVAPKNIEDWFGAASRFSGLVSQELRDFQAYNYFTILRDGVQEFNLFNQKVEVTANPAVNLSRIRPKSMDTRLKSVDYPDAEAAFTKYNHVDGRSHDIDTWVVHFIYEGTYAGAISYFQDSDAKVSAHFVIRHTDGEISQVVKAADTAWHCGAKNGQSNNQRSIGIEHEVTIAHPEWWDSKPMLKGSAKIARHFCDKYGIKIKHAFPGIVGHKEMPGCDTDCPGDCPWDTLMGLITDDTPAPAPDPSSKTGIVDSSDGVGNVRKGPDITYSVLTTLKNGTVVKVTGLEEVNWYKVIIPDGRTGYLNKSILTVK